jgi:hypothetical protein
MNPPFTGSPKFEELRSHIRNMPTGEITDTAELELMLAGCWGELRGSDAGGMAAYKLRDRMEQVRWNPPNLKFSIERHGAAALGSVYAEVQSWAVDIEQGIATLEPESRRRQVKSKNPPLKVQPIAKTVAGIITSGGRDECLVWKGPDKVRLLIGNVIPNNCPAQTLSGRRRRFRKALEEELQHFGWELVSRTSWSFMKKRS